MPPEMARVRQAFFTGGYRVTRHGWQQMLERNICTADLEEAIGKDVPEIIEDNPHDLKGPSCLILGWIGEG